MKQEYPREAPQDSRGGLPDPGEPSRSDPPQNAGSHADQDPPRPRTLDALEEGPTRERADLAVASPNKPVRGRILVADDDDPFRRTLLQFLARQGFECEGAPDAPSAARLLLASEFDLLISDISMPGNDGLELIRNLPQLTAGLPVILLTGHPTVDTAALSVRFAVEAYLIKPPDLDALIGLVRQAVAKCRAFRSVTANQKRLQDWCNDLDQIKAVLRGSPGSDPAAPWQTFLTLSLRHIIESLVDLKAFTEALAPQGDPSPITRRLESSQPLVLLDALRETITVLEKTKGAFKSRELGDLRKKLERLVQGG